MPLFPEVNTYYKGRTHTQLVVSEGVAPAEKWIPSASEAVKFQYAFGPEGNQNVVIPKGKIVTLAGLEWDYETEHNVPAIKIAKEADTNVIGVNHHNVYERRRDRFSGNAPTVITREYIEVPVFTTQNAANDIKFGAAWNADPGSMLGKFVKSDNYGNFQVATGAEGYGQVIGQVLGVETDVPPAGFLQYFMEMSDNDYTKFVQDMSYAPSAGKTPDQGIYDSGTYPLGTSYLQQANAMQGWNSGIERLTDGYFRSRTEVTGITLNNIKASTMDATIDLESGSEYIDTDEQYAQVASIKTSGNVTVSNGIVAVGSDVRGAALFIKLKDKLANDALKDLSNTDLPEFSGANPSDVKVYLRTIDTAADPDEFVDTQVSPSNVHIDYTNNMVVVYFTEAVAGAKVLIDATMLINATPGIPTGWDFKGAVGAVRILLQR